MWGAAPRGAQAVKEDFITGIKKGEMHNSFLTDVNSLT